MKFKNIVINGDIYCNEIMIELMKRDSVILPLYHHVSVHKLFSFVKVHTITVCLTEFFNCGEEGNSFQR